MYILDAEDAPDTIIIVYFFYLASKLVAYSNISSDTESTRISV